MRYLTQILFVAFCLTLPMAHVSAAQSGDTPAITVTTVPQWDTGGPNRMRPIAGTVTGPNCDCQLVIFAHGDIWYVQPWTTVPYTVIKRDGSWSTTTHLGTEYAVFLVRKSYRPPAITRTLPRLSGDVLAMTRVPGRR